MKHQTSSYSSVLTTYVEIKTLREEMPVPFSSAHVLYTFSGALPGGEVWSVGLRTIAATPTLEQLDALAASAGGAFAALWGRNNGGLKNINIAAVTFNHVTVRAVSAAGVTTAQAEAVVGTLVGAATAQTAPNQGALVATLTTVRAGRSGKGRMYLPCLAPPWNAAGRVNNSDQVAAAVAEFINSMNNLSGAPAGFVRIGVQSRVTGQAAPPVTGVRVGDVLDTQRRRRDKLVENYTSVPVPEPGN